MVIIKHKNSLKYQQHCVLIEFRKHIYAVLF